MATADEHTSVNSNEADPLRTGAIFRVKDLSKLRSVSQRPKRRALQSRIDGPAKTMTESESKAIASEFTELLDVSPAPKRPTVSPLLRRMRPSDIDDVLATPPTKTNKVTKKRSKVSSRKRLRHLAPSDDAASLLEQTATRNRPSLNRSPISPGIKVTRSGRRSCRVLDWWKSERFVVIADGSAAILDNLSGRADSSKRPRNWSAPNRP